MSGLSSLISHLEKATGPDAELDARIRCVLFVGEGAFVVQSKINGAWCIYRDERGGKPRLLDPNHTHVPHALWRAEYTASVDAAISLAERVLPGWSWGVESFGEDGAQGRVWKHGWHDDTVVRADHSQPAIALVLATLRALQSQGEA